MIKGKGIKVKFWSNYREEMSDSGENKECWQGEKNVACSSHAYSHQPKNDMCNEWDIAIYNLNRSANSGGAT